MSKPLAWINAITGDVTTADCSDTILWAPLYLAPPKQEQEGVYQKLLRIEAGIEVEVLPSELWQDGYETGKAIAKAKGLKDE